jgi:two-component system, sensor histidine kinase and response regulator
MHSSHALAAHHDLSLVAVSVAVAVLASYTTLTLGSRIAESRGGARVAWLVGGSASMGIGIWSMHFIAMLAFTLPVPIRYDAAVMLWSLLVAIGASGLALIIVQRDVVMRPMYIASAFVMGGAISGMHYLGMHGLLVPLQLTYWPPLVAVSIAIAIIASGSALRIARGLRAPDAPWILRLVSAIVMGVAIAGMHYTAMAAVDLTPGGPPHEYAAGWVIAPHQLHGPVIVGSVLVLVLTMITAVTDMHFQTARRRASEAERAMRATEERFRAIVETTQEWIWEMNVKGVTTYSNPASLTLLGVPPTDLLGKDHLALVHSSDRLQGQACLEAAISGRTGWKNVVLRWQTRDGGLRFFESNAVPITDQHGILVGFRGADRDVSDRMQAQAMKSDFVSFVSHQLRTPLSGVSWMLELAAETPGLAPEAASYVTEARESANRLIRLVNDLLDLSRLESGRLVVQPRRLLIDDLVLSVVAEMQPQVKEKQLRLTVHRSHAPTAVYVDEQLLRQAIANLLSNAVKYTPANGSIDVTVATDGSRVRCAIRDTGIGVPPEALGRLFEKFYRADNAVVVESEGTGLGLSLVQLVVEHFGGRVWCESAAGQGSLFTFELPTAPLADDVPSGLRPERDSWHLSSKGTTHFSL